MTVYEYRFLTNLPATLIWIEHSYVLIWIRQTSPLQIFQTSYLAFVGDAPVASEVSDFRVPITTKEFTSKEHFRGKAFVSYAWIAQLVSIVVILEEDFFFFNFSWRQKALRAPYLLEKKNVGTL